MKWLDRLEVWMSMADSRTWFGVGMAIPALVLVAIASVF